MIANTIRNNASIKGSRTNLISRGLQQKIDLIVGNTARDRFGYSANIIYPCIEWLADTTLTLDSDPEATITEINGKADTTGYSIVGATISVDFSELPSVRLWQMKLSNGSEYYFFNSKRIFDHTGNDIHITNNGTLLTHFQHTEQASLNPYRYRGFNKYFRNLTGSEITLTFDSEDYVVDANGYLIVPTALLAVHGKLSDMTGDTSSAEIIDVPEDESNAGYDVFGAAIIYKQGGNYILNAEGCLIDFVYTAWVDEELWDDQEVWID